jgi:hypothetical protein
VALKHFQDCNICYLKSHTTIYVYWCGHLEILYPRHTEARTQLIYSQQRGSNYEMWIGTRKERLSYKGLEGVCDTWPHIDLYAFAPTYQLTHQESLLHLIKIDHQRLMRYSLDGMLRSIYDCKQWFIRYKNPWLRSFVW